MASQFLLARTEIQIWPETQTLGSKEKITVNTAPSTVSVSAKSIPGKIFEEEKTVSQEFLATGKVTKGEKAQGKIVVYNNYSTAAQVLVANTRFISSDGKLFRTVEKVTIPGGTLSGGKLQPGSLEIKVVADQAGEDYNIGATTFSIPGFVGTPKYTAFYGKSFEKMTGGSIGEVPQVTKEDLDKAKKALTDRVLEEGEASLKVKIPSDYILLDGAITSEIISATSSAIVGKESKNFTYQAKAKLKAVVFKESDFKNFLMEIAVSKKPDGQKIQEESLKSGSITVDSIDINAGKISLSFDMSAKTYSDINEEQLREALNGKPIEEAQQIMSNQEGIVKAQIKSWPFWISRMPEDAEEVKIELILD